MKPATVSQNEMLFIRGKAMSGAPIMSGTNQLPKPPMIAGMTMKNTMIRPCAVISTFHRWSAGRNRGWASRTARRRCQILDARLGQFEPHHARESRRR
jgi:hypothetical protein